MVTALISYVDSTTGLHFTGADYVKCIAVDVALTVMGVFIAKGGLS